MKKIKLLIVLLLLIPIQVKAATLELICPSVASPNSKIDCNIKTQDPLKGIKLNISLPTEISINKIDTNWTSYYKSNKGLVVTNNNNGENISKISLIISEQATVGAEYQIGLINIEASDNEHRLINTDNIYAKVKILSNDNTLSNLTISNGSLSPKFNKNITTYKATINSDKTTILATPSHNTSKLKGSIGNINLNYGINNLTITVTSEIGTIKTYSIIITRPFPTVIDPAKNTTNNSNNSNSTKSNNYNKKKNIITKKQDTSKIVIPKSSDASLKELKVKGYEIDFKPNKFNYKLKVKNNITTLNIIATPNNNKSKVEITKPDILEVGKNIITITVTSENGTICKYLIEVIRDKEKTKKQETPTTGEIIKSNKEVPIFPSIPLAILILIILLILLILYITIKRIFKKVI